MREPYHFHPRMWPAGSWGIPMKIGSNQHRKDRQHLFRHSRESGNPGFLSLGSRCEVSTPHRPWIPAYNRMTRWKAARHFLHLLTWPSQGNGELPQERGESSRSKSICLAMGAKSRYSIHVLSLKSYQADSSLAKRRRPPHAAYLKDRGAWLRTFASMG